MQLHNINLLADVLKTAKGKEEPYFVRLYDDAFMALVSLGVETENESLVIDDDTYPASDKVKKILRSNGSKINPSKNDNKRAQEQRPAVPVSAKKDMVAETPASTPIPTPKAEVTPTFTNTAEKPLIVSKITAKLTKKADQSDYHEVKFLVFPLKVTDNAASSDIAVVMNTGGKQYTFVSPPSGGRRSIDCQAGDETFTVRGQWKSGHFEAFVNPAQKVTETYKIETKSKVVFPSEIDATVYEATFSKEIGEDIIYVFPHNKANEPNGIAKSTIVVESADLRQAFTEADGTKTASLSGTDFRLYGKWEDNGFVIGHDPVG